MMRFPGHTRTPILAYLGFFSALWGALLTPTACYGQQAGRLQGDKRSPITFVAVGDICFAGGVERASAEAPADYPFRFMRPTLRGADIAFGNLECALTQHDVPIPKRYNFGASPQWAKRLAAAGFDAVSVANNHTQDFGRKGLADTLTALRNAKLLAVGGGMTLAEAHAARIIERSGIRVALLAYLGMFPPLLPIAERQPSVAMADASAFERDISAARRKANVVVVSLHAGVEMQTTPSVRQKTLARSAVDAGADLVVGHHPHMVQPLERYRGRPIFYSLGNFVFNPSPSFLRNPGGPWSGMAEVTIGPSGIVSYKLIPLRIVDRQPRHVKR